ncbi:MAG: gliding motility-associated protein GldE [Bacteroidetes bacterium]|nr:gliding motility-associated protein GldE [Bacteroidota bacterium]
MESTDTDPLSFTSLVQDSWITAMEADTWIFLLIILVLLVFSALISGSETAFFSLSPFDLTTLKNRGEKKDLAILALLEKPKRLLSTILIANNFVNVGIVILSAFIVDNFVSPNYHPALIFFIQVVVVTSILLIFGEIIPKILANKEPMMVANLMVNNLRFLISLFKPLSSLLINSTRLIDKRIKKKSHPLSMSDLSDAIDLTVGESITDHEKKILKGIATFGETEATEIMQSRVNITAIDASAHYTEVLQTVLESGFSRIPVYKESLDEVVGILYIKDLIPHLNKPVFQDWISLLRPPFFVPENKRINDLLQEFRQKKNHLAIVVDEYGGTSGIITLEDIIEEIVGDISDEFDKEPHQFKHEVLPNNHYLFEAKTPLNDFYKIMHLKDDYFDKVVGDADSLGGLMLELQGRIPLKGDKIKYRRFEFIIHDADERKIKEIEVAEIPPTNKTTHAKNK